MYRGEKQIKTQLSPGCLASGRSESERGDCSVAVDCYAPPLSDSVSFDFAISASIWAQSSLLRRDLIASYGQRLSDHPGQLGCQGGAGCGPGAVSVNVKDYIFSGSNTVQLQVTDSYSNSRVKNFTITVVELTLTSSFDDSTIQTEVLVFPYTPYGAVSKTVHFILDGTEMETVTTSVSARQQTYIIPQQSHGAHTLRVYFESTVNGNTVRSNELYYAIIWYRISENTPIIASSYNQFTVMQFTTMNIPYTVYTPNAQMSDVVIRADGRTASEITVDRTRQTFSYRFNNTGTHSVTFTTGGTLKTMTFTVIAADIDCHAETENLVLHLSSASRSNNEANPGIWTYGTGEDQIAATFTNFNWKSDGWQMDADGLIALRVSGDARLTIP